jgi:FAD/FMN-containing dehydrogenase
MNHSDIVAALRECLGDRGVLTGDDVRQRSSGWGINGCDAFALARPSCTEEVAEVLRLCHRHDIPVVSQGGCTGLVGGGVARPDELVLSLERMSGIEDIDVTGRTMTVLAGTPLQAVHEAAADQGLDMPLDLGARGSATIGGNIATNAGGNGVIRYGMMREQVLGLEVVLADGTVLSSMNHVLKNNTGYDLKQLFIGSEGTLGIVTRAVLRLRPLMAARNSALVATSRFDHIAQLLTHVERGLGGTLSAFEVMWRNYYDLASPAVSPPPLSGDHPYYLLIESAGADAEADAARFLATLEEAMEQGLVADAVLAQSEQERSNFWKIRDNIESLIALWPLISFDVSLPIRHMEGYLGDLERELSAITGELRWAVFGHLGDGNLHIIVALGSDAPERKRAVEEVVYGRLEPLGGSISAEHGIGLDKRDYLHLSRSEDELRLMRGIKQALDPKGLLNPGKIFPEA